GLVAGDRSDLREGYAEVGDVRLHYVEAGAGPLIVLLHGFPEFWFGWRLQTRSRRPHWSSGGSATASSAPSWPSPTTMTCLTSTGSSGCPTRHIGSITTRRSASIGCSSTSLLLPPNPTPPNV